MNRLFSAALLSCAAAFLSNPAWSFQGFDFFQQIEQSIECVRKPGTDYLVCTNKFVPAEESQDEEDTSTDTTPVSNPEPTPTGRYYFSEPSELVISERYFPEVHDLAPIRDHAGPPNTDLGTMELADFDQNGLPDVALTLWWVKGRQLTDPEICADTTRGDNTGTCFDNLDHDQEQWNKSWVSNVIILQKAPGVWEVGNRELFGYDRPTFGYRGRKTEITDFNNDGYPDYYRAGSWEDGRAPEWLDPDDRWSPSNWGSAPQKVMISNGDGTYTMEDLGIQVYGHGGTAALMQNGQWDAIHCSGRVSDRYYREPDLTFTYQGVSGIKLGEGLIPAQVRAWYNGEQEVIEGYPSIGCGDFRASEPEEINGEVYSRYLIDQGDTIGWTFRSLEWCLNNREKCDDDEWGNPGISYSPSNYVEYGGEGRKHGFVLWEQIDSQWVEVDTYVWGKQGGYLEFYDNSDRSLQGDERSTNEWQVIDYGDTWGLGVGPSDSCSIKMYPDSDPIFIFGFDGMKIPKDVPEPVDLELLPEPVDATTYTYKAIGLINGELTEIDIWPQGNKTTSGRVFMCDDINGDGYDDLYAKTSPFWEAASPEFVVWLNDQNGGLVKTKVQVDNPQEDFTGGVDINAEAELGEASEYYGYGFGEQIVKDVNGDGIGDLVSYEMTGGLGSDPSEYPKFTVRYGINPQEIASP